MAKKRKTTPKKRRSTPRSRRANIRTIVISLLLICTVLLYFSANYRSVKRVKISNVTINEKPKQPALSTEKITSQMELPLYEDSTFLIRNRDGRYTLMYDTLHRQPRWVAYMLTKEEVNYKGVDRKDSFKEDSKIKVRGWKQGHNNDYKKSGYDKGHLLPSADRDDTRAENDATFLFSNISPQLPALNRRVWADLEGKVRQWADRYDTLYVVTAPILPDSPRSRLGDNKITIPEYFYKVLMAPYRDSYISIGYLLPNRADLSSDLDGYALSVDEVEQMTGLDFFWMVDDTIEDRMESEYNLKRWN